MKCNVPCNLFQISDLAFTRGVTSATHTTRVDAAKSCRLWPREKVRDRPSMKTEERTNRNEIIVTFMTEIALSFDQQKLPQILLTREILTKHIDEEQDTCRILFRRRSGPRRATQTYHHSTALS